MVNQCFMVGFVEPLLGLQVMLLANPSLEELYHKSCALAEDTQEVKDSFQHPARLIKVHDPHVSATSVRTVGVLYFSTVFYNAPLPVLHFQQIFKTVSLCNLFSINHLYRWIPFKNSWSLVLNCGRTVVTGFSLYPVVTFQHLHNQT